MATTRRAQRTKRTKFQRDRLKAALARVSDAEFGKRGRPTTKRIDATARAMQADEEADHQLDRVVAEVRRTYELGWPVPGIQIAGVCVKCLEREAQIFGSTVTVIGGRRLCDPKKLHDPTTNALGEPRDPPGCGRCSFLRGIAFAVDAARRSLRREERNLSETISDRRKGEVTAKKAKARDLVRLVFEGACPLPTTATLRTFFERVAAADGVESAGPVLNANGDPIGTIEVGGLEVTRRALGDARREYLNARKRR